MKYEVRTEEQLIQELEDLRRRIAELEESETEFNRAEAELLDSVEKYRLISENSNDWIYLIKPDKTFQYVSPSCERITGYPSIEFINNPGLLLDIIHPDDKEQVESHLEIVREETTVHNSEFRIFNKAGELRWIRHSCLPVYNNESQYVGRSGSNRDITPRKNAEEALRESEELYRTVFEQSNDGIALVKEDQHIHVNQKMMEIFGYERLEDIVGQRVTLLVHPDDQEQVKDINRRRQRGEAVPQKYEFKGQRKDGESLFIEVSATKISLQGENLSLAILRDITERKQMEEKLRQSEERYRNILESIEEGYYEVDIAGNLTFFNDSLCNLLGYSRDELMGLNNRRYTDEENATKLYKTFNEVYRTGIPVKDFDWRVIRKDGTTAFGEISVSPIRDREGNITGFRGIARDITERKQLEDAIKTLSIKDDLTGLYNRRGFFALAEQGLKMAQRMGTEILLIYGDLDNLKKINDTFGHKEGDQALVDISQILKETFRKSDIIARIGGDEFVILAMNNSETSAEKLIHRFEQVLNDHRLQTKSSHKLAMSFGIACFDPKNPSSIDALLVEADKLMYGNKQKKSR